MNPWPFVIAAYAVTGLGTVGLLAWAWRSMRVSEGEADRLGRRP